jgi:glycosyltransferase involved in cell wall biosynthesis
MQDTLSSSLASILRQIDERFEVVVVDDGSSDDSLFILEFFQSKFASFKYFALARDRKRKLGLTRNFSIQKASGDWVVLHLDADDEVGEGLLEFVENVLLINSIDSTPVLYSGHQIHMAQREWLLSIGPYRNLYRLEDRDLYQRLIPRSQWRILQHDPFITRLRRSRGRSLCKAIRDAFDHLVSDTRYEVNFSSALRKELSQRVRGSMQLRIYRIVCLPLAFWMGRRLGVLGRSLGDFSDQGVRLYRQQNTRTVEEWCLYLSKLKDK